MTITLDDVQRIAHLARIEIDAGRGRATCAPSSTAIFATDRRAAGASTPPASCRCRTRRTCALPLREDRVTETDRHALYQSVAPAVEDGLYLVPKVIE